MCDEIIEKTKNTSIKTILTKSISTKSNSKNFYILLGFLLITITLLIAVSIYCYFIKYKQKQEHLLPYYVTNNKSEVVLY